MLNYPRLGIRDQFVAGTRRATKPPLPRSAGARESAAVTVRVVTSLKVRSLVPSAICVAVYELESRKVSGTVKLRVWESPAMPATYHGLGHRGCVENNER